MNTRHASSSPLYMLIISLICISSLQAQPLTNITFVAFDTETTGRRRDDRIVEIAAVRFKNGLILERRSWLVNPGVPIPKPVQAIHGISDDMVKDSPTFEAVFKAFMAFVRNDVLMAHNATFDIRMIQGDITRHGLATPDAVIFDSLRLSRAWFPEAPSHSLENLVKRLKIRSEGHHRALQDATYLVEVFNAGIKKMPENADLNDLKALARKTLSFNPQAHTAPARTSQ